MIVGAGLMGMAAGYYLVKSGKRTLLVDSFNPSHDKGSHQGDTRIIRYAYGEGEEYVPLALKAKETPQGFYYGIPSINGTGLKVGRHDGGEKVNPDHPKRTFCEDDEGELSHFLQQYMPLHGPLKRGEPCMYTRTPDEDFIMDLHPNYSHGAIAAGFSGHGFWDAF